MSKIFGYYSNDVDHAWFDSSNVKYAECIDHENELKTLKVVFSSGTQYQYENVKVQDYLLFREDASQGKALNKYIKGGDYKYAKLENANLSDINDELEFRSEGGLTIKNSGSFELLDNKDNIIYMREEPLDDNAEELVKEVLEAVGKKIRNI